MTVPECDLCGRVLDDPDDMPASANCGGTCRHCMASLVEDPDEIRNMGWPSDDEDEETMTERQGEASGGQDGASRRTVADAAREQAEQEMLDVITWKLGHDGQRYVPHVQVTLAQPPAHGEDGYSPAQLRRIAVRLQSAADAAESAAQLAGWLEPHGIDPDTVRATVLAAGKAAGDNAVKALTEKIAGRPAASPFGGLLGLLG